MNNNLSIVDALTIEDLSSFLEHSNFCAPLDVPAEESKRISDDIRQMLLIRKAEERIADLVKSGEIRCPCHLAIGQEAIPVGISRHLFKSDRVFGGHRSHGHFLAAGGDVEQLFAEIYGKESGCSRGMGGSMHLIDLKNGFGASVPIVGATIPIATGAALTFKMRHTSNVAVSYFGDGATEEGVFHESLNFASLHKLPILFVCENNLYSSHLDIKLRQPSDMTARFAVAHKIPALVIDGNNVMAVSEATEQLLIPMREGNGPAYMEVVTFRWRGHVGADENIDVGVRRKAEDLRVWKERDPIKRASDGLLDKSLLKSEELRSIERDIESMISSAVDFARKADFPPVSSLTHLVYPPDL